MWLRPTRIKKGGKVAKRSKNRFQRPKWRKEILKKRRNTMKKKSICTVLAVSLIFVLSILVLTACNPKHTHTYDSTKWETDENNHWHPATCGHNDLKKDVAAHTFDEGRITVEPTEEADGEKVLTCTVCKYEKKKAIPKLDHTHKFDESRWETDDDYHWHPATCGHADATKDKAMHVFDAGVITTAPTETTEGVKTYTCEVCGKKKTEKINMVNAIFTSGGVVLNKVYDGNAFSLTAANFTTNFGGTIASIQYKVNGAQDDSYTSTAPTKAGKYYVLVKATATGNIECEKVFEINITQKSISSQTVSHKYNASDKFVFVPSGIIAGDVVSVEVTMSSANVGATLTSVKLLGEAADNYTINKEDITATIVKADIGDDFVISNAEAFNNLLVGKAIPDPTSAIEVEEEYHGSLNIVWEKADGDNWVETTKDAISKASGNYRVTLKLSGSANVNGKTAPSLEFALQKKTRIVTIDDLASRDYNANYYFVKLNETTQFNSIHLGLTDYTSPDSGEKTAQYRIKGGEWIDVKNNALGRDAGEYEYRVIVGATAEWAEQISEIKTFTINKIKFRLKSEGYIVGNVTIYPNNVISIDQMQISSVKYAYLRLRLDGSTVEHYIDSSTNKPRLVPLKRYTSVPKANFFIHTYDVYPDGDPNIIIESNSSQTVTTIVTTASMHGKSGSITKTDTWQGTEKYLRVYTTVGEYSLQKGNYVEVYNGATPTGIKAEIYTVLIVNDSGAMETPSPNIVLPSDGKIAIILKLKTSDLPSGFNLVGKWLKGISKPET